MKGEAELEGAWYADAQPKSLQAQYTMSLRGTGGIVSLSSLRKLCFGFV